MITLIAISLGIMFILTLISVISGNSFLGSNQISTVDTEAIINGSTSTFDISGISGNFSLDPLSGAIVWITVVVVIGVIIGINVLGSGLSERATHLAYMGIFYIAIWAIFTALTMNLIIAIETFGGLIYLTLTIMYAVGCIQTIGND